MSSKGRFLSLAIARNWSLKGKRNESEEKVLPHVGLAPLMSGTVIIIGITPSAIILLTAMAYCAESGGSQSATLTLLVPIMIEPIMGLSLAKISFACIVSAGLTTQSVTHRTTELINSPAPLQCHPPLQFVSTHHPFCASVESLKAFIAAAFEMPVMGMVNACKIYGPCVLLSPQVTSLYLFHDGLCCFHTVCRVLKLSIMACVKTTQ